MELTGVSTQNIFQIILYKNTFLSVHIRRTDKIGIEADYFTVNEYFKHVRDYNEFLDMVEPSKSKLKKNVYLATDDDQVLDEAIKKLLKNYQNF